MVDDYRRVNRTKAEEWDNKARKAREQYKLPMFTYYITKLLAWKNLTGEVMPQLQAWYDFANPNIDGLRDMGGS